MAELDDMLDLLAKELGTSSAKLHCVYLRGVKECCDKGFTGSPSTYGLARVQRFALAFSQSNHRMTPDTDLLPRDLPPTSQSQTSYELSNSSWPLIYDYMSGNSSSLSSAFNDIESTVYDKDTGEIIIYGPDWTVALDTTTGEHKILN